MTQAATTQPEVIADTQPQMLLQAIDLSSGYAKRPVIEDVSCGLYPGELLGIIGPNGCGKSTLLKTLSGNLSPMTGQVLLDGEPLAAMPRYRRAHLLAMLPQHPDAPPGMTVRDLARCGRSPHAKWFQPFDASDQTAIDHAIRSCELDDLADQPLAEISGGERQRAWIAMTLAQQTRVLLLDEPTSALDIGHQLDVMHLLEHLVHQRNLAVAVIMHDINLAIRFCDRVLVLDKGQIVGQCCTDHDTDWSLLERVFKVSIGTDAHMEHDQILSFTRSKRCHL